MIPLFLALLFSVSRCERLPSGGILIQFMDSRGPHLYTEWAPYSFKILSLRDEDHYRWLIDYVARIDDGNSLIGEEGDFYTFLKICTYSGFRDVEMKTIVRMNISCPGGFMLSGDAAP